MLNEPCTQGFHVALFPSSLSPRKIHEIRMAQNFSIDKSMLCLCCVYCTLHLLNASISLIKLEKKKKDNISISLRILSNEWLKQSLNLIENFSNGFFFLFLLLFLSLKTDWSTSKVLNRSIDRSTWKWIVILF